MRNISGGWSPVMFDQGLSLQGSAHTANNSPNLFSRDHIKALRVSHTNFTLNLHLEAIEWRDTTAREIRSGCESSLLPRHIPGTLGSQPCLLFDAVLLKVLSLC